MIKWQINNLYNNLKQDWKDFQPLKPALDWHGIWKCHNLFLRLYWWVLHIVAWNMINNFVDRVGHLHRLAQTCKNLHRLAQLCTNLLHKRCIVILCWYKMVWLILLRKQRLAQYCTKLHKLVQTCTDLLRLAWSFKRLA